MQSTALLARITKNRLSETEADSSRNEKKARLLVRELAEVFSAPVGLLDASSGEWLGWEGASAEQYPELDLTSLENIKSTVRGEGAVALWQSKAEVNRIWLVIRLEQIRHEALLGLIPFQSIHAGEEGSKSSSEGGWSDSRNLSEPVVQGAKPPCGPPCPEPALKAWGEQVALRVRRTLSENADESEQRISGPSEHLVIGRLIRRMKISDPPRGFQSLTTNVVKTSLGVDAVAWVPANDFEPVIVSGEIAGLGNSAYRALAPATLKDSATILRSPTDQWISGNTDQIRKYAAVPGGTVGWLIAVNPALDQPRCENDLEIMRYSASLIATQLNNAKIYAELKELLFGIIRALTAAIDAKDPYTCGHSERVARIAVRLAEEMSITPQKRSDLYLAGLLHDIGKIGIDDELLRKSGPLNPEEYRKIQSHVEIGVTILNDLKKLHHILPGVRHHHESHDGNGYPDRLSGEEIPLEARILAVADSFDAMSSNRPYRRRLTPLQINEILQKGRGIQWDPRVIDALFACRMDLEAIRQKGLGESLLGAVDVTLGRR